MKPNFIVLILALCVTIHVRAVPASPKPFNFTQPDGTTLTLRTVGDEYYHWTETTDNQIVLLSDDGYYEYATILKNELVPSGVRVANDVFEISKSRNTNTTIANREQIVNLMINKRNSIITKMDSLTQAENLLDSPSNAKSSSVKSLTKGNQKVLCILIDFPDKHFSQSKTDFENMWNQTNYSAEGSYGSIKDFYTENSFG